MNTFKVEILDNDLIPLKEGDEFILLSTLNGIIGLSCFIDRKPIYIIHGFSKEEEDIYIGFYRQSTKEYFRFAPFKIIDKKTSLEVPFIVSKDNSHYIVQIDDIYQRINI